MSEDGARRFDKATRDYHHELRRIHRRRAMSIANWTIVPWLIAAAVISAVFCIWEFLGTGKNGVETDSRRRVGENQLESDKRHYNIIPTELDPFRNRTS